MFRSRFCLPLLLFLAAACGCGSGEKEAEKNLAPKGGKVMPMELTSPAFREGETIPKKYTADGQDVSPPLRWTDPPGGTKSFALICDDPDAPRGTWVHWVLFNVPDVRELDEGVPPEKELSSGARQGKNDFGKVGYGGPSPPAGKPHHYFFKLFAVDGMLDLKAGATKAQLLAALEGHVLGEGKLMGLYGR
jgi:Raf kinase inhibitor-like YbhB/YbcL family protein